MAARRQKRGRDGERRREGAEAGEGISVDTMEEGWTEGLTAEPAREEKEERRGAVDGSSFSVSEEWEWEEKVTDGRERGGQGREKRGMNDGDVR